MSRTYRNYLGHPEDYIESYRAKLGRDGKFSKFGHGEHKKFVKKRTNRLVRRKQLNSTELAKTRGRERLLWW